MNPEQRTCDASTGVLADQLRNRTEYERALAFAVQSAESRARCLLSLKFLVEDHCQVTIQKADGRYYAYDVSVKQWVLGEGSSLEEAVENFRQKWLERFPKIGLHPQSRSSPDPTNAGPPNAAAKLGPPDSRSPHTSNPPTNSGTHANPS